MGQNKDAILITNIQRFSLHDGPGIRTTVFLKGCSLHCPWCCNPENISLKIQHFLKDGKNGIYGIYYTPAQLYDEIIKDKAFYTGDIDNYSITTSDQIDHLPGGITFSGGECMLQMKQLEPLFIRLHEEHIHTAIETSLFIPSDTLNIAIKYIDLFYVDIKILDEDLCKKHLHGNLSLYLSNLNTLMKSSKPVVMRIPVIGGYTDDDENRSRVADLINQYVKDENANLLKIELIKEHNLGINKYRGLIEAGGDFKMPDYSGVSDSLMECYRNEIKRTIGDNIPVEVCRI